MAAILVIAAVSDELQGLARQLEAPAYFRKNRGLHMGGHLAGKKVHLLETGPGLVNTAMALTAAIEAEPPALVIQTGCAGVFEASGLSNGDIGIATLEIDAQLGIEAFADGPPVSPLPFPILQKGSVRIQNRYPIDLNLARKAHNLLKQTMAGTAVKIETGPFLTVVTVTATDQRAQKLHGTYGCLMENMEGVAAAHVCIHYDIPFLEIRSGSNRVGDRNKDTWTLPLAFERASRAVVDFIATNPSIIKQD